MKTRTSLTSLAALALVVAISAPAAASDEPEPDEPIAVDIIEGITWQLERQAVDGVMSAVPGDVSVTLLLQDGEASGNGGCNQYSGSYTRDGDQLTLGPIIATEMFCPDGGSEVEAAYFANLPAVASAFSTGGTLVMADAGGESLLEFSPQPERVGVFGIEDMDWMLTGQAVDGVIVDVPANVMVTLRMEDGRADGNGGCNSYFASYEIDGFDVSFGDIGATLMGCPEDVMAVESAYFANLARVARYQSGGIEMAFLDADGDIILEFAMAPQATVVGAWVATGINNGREAVVGSDITSEVTAEFDADGDLSGFDGCNRYFTSYEVEGDRITISDAIGSTRMACPSDELAEQAQQYVDALLAATTWSVDAASGRLELRDDGGALQVSFAPAG